ncbi:YfhO family protein [Streptomyces sp. G-G2]|uniref:YfhO family protein n=1 Tax=Streptomyces sp. G-G2 TaxID=3046201 RepID=UPI0024BBDD99|nr:YfhO family protein [Streptomyces sp. G-G2]MDJ0384697.1 YfhO family protein [Streptomyces sp. G-G2]
MSSAPTTPAPLPGTAVPQPAPARDRGPGPGRPAAARRRTGPLGALAALASALMSMAAYCAGLAAHGTYPFGPVPRADNDLRHQYVPFHTHLWDLQHGTAPGDLLYNWQSGYGVGFLGDFFTYLANPFSWLVGLFPRDQSEFPVFLVSLFSLGLAAAAMTVFLGRLRPGSPWLRALLSVGYATCGWNLAEGAVVPMWTWGLVALPLLGIAADWCLTGRRWVLGSLLVALCWYANFYTAAMATLAAALVLLLRLAIGGADARARGRALWRAATMTATGMLLAAPAILVCGLANAQAQPTDKYVVSVATPLRTYLAMFLPGSLASPSAPNVYAGSLALLLALALPFQARVPVRERIAWGVLIAATALSFVITPTAELWQGFALPHGAPFRESFVLSGFLVMAAWVCLARMPRPRALLGGAALLGVLIALSYGTQPLGERALTGSLLGGAAVTGLLLLYARGLPRPARRAVVGLLAAAVLWGAAFSAHGLTELLDPAQRGPARAQTMTRLGLNTRHALVPRDDWPASRTDPGPEVFVTNNDAMLLGAQGGSYYSSYITRETAAALAGLGLGEAMGGRHLWPARDPVLQALLGIGTTLDVIGTDDVRVRDTPAVPLVAVRPPGSDRAYGAPADSVWARRQAALGAKVYTVPALTPADPARGLRLGPDPADGTGPGNTFTARCAPGARAFLHAPALRADVAAPGGASEGFYGAPPLRLAPLKELGTAGADGRFSFTVRTREDGQSLPADALGCLDVPAFEGAVRNLRERGGASVETGGHSFTARLPKGSAGTAVVATTVPPGWTCSVDGGPARPPVSYQGLLGVPLGTGASRVACGYLPPGLTAGLAGAGAGALALVGVPLLTRRRGR